MTIPYPQAMQGRTELLLGSETLSRIHATRVIIFGVGGVGSWCAECLVRSGIRQLTIVDSDKVCLTNCNRQLMATSQTVGQVKVEALRQRLLLINPEAQIEAINQVYNATTADSFKLETYDFVIDAIDSLAEKADLILRVTSLPPHITLFCSMGAALRIDPFKVRQAEFWKVQGDPLARALRNRFKKQGVFPRRKFYCVYSEEPALTNLGVDTAYRDTLDDSLPDSQEWIARKAQVNGSLCHITAIFGMSIAGMVLQKIAK